MYLMDAMDLYDVLQFALVCREARERVASYMTRRFRLHNVIRPFVKEADVEDFRAMMQRYQVAISGSIAVQFFARMIFNFCDMDLYVETKYAPGVSKWLKDAGYELIMVGNTLLEEEHSHFDVSEELFAEMEMLSAGESNEEEVTLEPITATGYIGERAVLTYSHKTNRRKVQIIRCEGTPIQTILKFHSSKFVSV